MTTCHPKTDVQSNLETPHGPVPIYLRLQTIPTT